MIYGYAGGLVLQGLDSTGSSGLTRYDLASNTVLLAPGTYAIDKVSVAASGAVTFSGRRAVDNARVLGSIAAPPADPIVEVLVQSLSGDVQQLVVFK